MATRPTEGSATERVYHWVRAQILDGDYEGGRLLSEGEVSDAVGVSRTPVREAFLQLASEDMLQLYPKRGALVLAVGTAELREVLIARALLEPWAAQRIAGSPDRAGVVARLRDHIKTTRDILTSGEVHAFHEADREFHQTLVSAAGNQLIAEFYSSLRDRQLRGATLAMRTGQTREAEIVAQHEAIADALERGDAAGAKATIAEHLNGTAELLGLA